MEPAVLLDAVGIVVGVLALWLGARWLVDAASTLAAGVGVSPLVIGLTVVAFGTSAPEVAVSAGAALAGRGDVAVGNVVGSNGFNVAIILGIVAVLAPFRVTDALLRRDAVAMGAATGIGIGALVDLRVTTLEGAVLVALLVAYLLALWASARGGTETPSASGDGSERTDGDERGVLESSTTAADRLDRLRNAARLLVGLGIVALGGRLLVSSATALALDAGVSEWFVGVTIVAAGTSLPELVTAVVATRRGDVAIAAGNVVGSNVFNVLGVLGIAALVRPLSVDGAALAGLLWVGVLTLGATVLLATGRRVTRLEGLVLLAAGTGYWIVTALG
ncbi:calcium/sodium antiporter [Halopiger aswanensis]|uniref:Cation:H+ antiporter n=1 Tax=Halopiger aswanensis TaxID=148449 RepID=A0A419WI83_9EURY|nr:calcium/sodium antiporter [Halopiger aswanensis]RKD95153.1 cation:H+ antiporter [Halopiger aswanensis]